MLFSDFSSTPAAEYDYLKSCILAAAQNHASYLFPDVTTPLDCIVSSVSLAFACSPDAQEWSMTVTPAFTYDGNLPGIRRLSEGQPIFFPSFDAMADFMRHITDPSLTIPNSRSPQNIYTSKLHEVALTLRSLQNDLEPLVEKAGPILKKYIEKVRSRNTSSSDTMPPIDVVSSPVWERAEKPPFTND